MQTMETVPGSLRGILEGLMKVDGVTAAMVVGRDGFVIEVTSAEGIDTDAVGAIAASGLTSSEIMGGELRAGPLGSMLIEYEQGPVAVMPAGPDAVLAVVGDRRANLGRLRVEMRKLRAAVAAQL